MGPTPKNHRPSALSEASHWFAYAEERRIGPFSTSEIQSKLIDETLRPDDLVWKNGMADWHPISALELFYPDAPVAVSTPSTPALEPIRTFVRETPFILSSPMKPAPAKRRAPYLYGALAFALLAGAITYSRIPRALPYVSDISTAEEKEFTRVAALPFRDRAVATIALAQTNPAVPSFHIATNAPTGASLELLVEGVPGAILSLTPIRASQSLTVRDHLAHSRPILRMNGRPLAAGSYRISVLNSSGARIADRVLFLGGIAGPEYAQALQRLNENLPKQRAAELVELRQVAAALEDQLTETTAQFRSPSTWKAFSARWTAFEKQLALELRPTATDDLDVYHTALFARARSVLDQIGQIHTKQAAWIGGRTKRDSLEMEIAEETAIAQSGILTLKGEITLTEKKTAAAKK